MLKLSCGRRIRYSIVIFERVNHHDRQIRLNIWNINSSFYTISVYDKINDNDTLYRNLQIYGDYTDKPDWTSYSTCDGLLDENVWSIAEDKNNNMWFSGFDGVATKFKDAEDKRTIGATDLYVSDWGEIRAVPNRFCRAKDVFLFDMSTWELRWLRPTFKQALAIVGDYKREQVVEELALVALDEKANAYIGDLGA